MRLIIRIFACLCACALLSCRIGLTPKQQIQNLKSPANLNHAVKQTLKQKSIFAEKNWPDSNWWINFQSAELNNLIEQALVANPTIQEINSRIVVAKQESVVTGSLLFPLVYFDASDTRRYLSKNGLYRAFNPKLPLNANLIDLSLSFQYNFDFWGQNRNLLCAAIGKTKVARAEAAEVKLIITTALAQAYFAYKTNLSRQELYQQLALLRKNIAELQGLLIQKGLSSNLLSFTPAENYLEAKKWLASINEELASNLHLINILAGKNPDSPLSKNKKLPALPLKLSIPKNISLDLVSRRPDLMAQIWRAKAQAYNTGAAMADFYPNVNIRGLLGLESVTWKKLFDISSGTAAIKPALHLPIFTAGAINANIQANKAEFDAAIFAYNNLLLRSTQEILDSLDFASSIYQQKKEQIGIVSDAQQRYQLVNLRQQKGLDSQFELYQQQEELIQKRLVDISLTYNQYLASIKLIKALGGGYVETDIPLVKNV